MIDVKAIRARAELLSKLDNVLVKSLTKREYFAVMAMNGMFTTSVVDDSTVFSIAKNAVIMADTLIAELEKE